MIRASGSCRRTLMMTISIHVCKYKVMMIRIDMMIVIDIHDDSSHNDMVTVIVMMIIIFENNDNYSHDGSHDIHDDNQISLPLSNKGCIFISDCSTPYNLTVPAIHGTILIKSMLLLLLLLL